MYAPTVSVIINTYNRGPHLKRLLDALFRQTYDNYEVVVVNGPSTDCTKEVIREYRKAIRSYKCPVVNLSVSRNIGIRKAAGEIVAFIDDDAVPQDSEWIGNAVRYFEDDRVGIVGGTVYQLGGGVMFRYGWFDIFGQNIAITDNPIIYDDPKGERYSCGQGCNVFFRRNAIVKACGYDEYYAYYLDESDLGMRIIQQGYTCRYGEHMAVVHEAASGPNRESEFHENLFVVGKSQGYFVLKATERTDLSKENRKKIARNSILPRLENMKWWLDHNLISQDEYAELTSKIKDGIEQGIRDSEFSRRLDFGMGQNKGKFRRFNKSFFSGHQNICILCGTTRDDMPEYTRSLIKALSACGNHVYAIVKGEKTKLDLIDGVNYCIVKTGEPNKLGTGVMSYIVFSVLQELKQTFGVKMIIAPIQDTMIWMPACRFTTKHLYTIGDAGKTGDVIWLRKTGFQYGPYIMLTKGKYAVEYSGNNLQLVDDYHATADKGKRLIHSEVTEKSDHKVRYVFSIEDRTEDVEFAAVNQSDSTTEITEVILWQIG